MQINFLLKELTLQKLLKMESTPKSQDTNDSGCCLDSSRFPLENTSIGESTPISFMSRKRKAYVESFPSPPNTPQFSSTLNESLMENLEKCHLQNYTLSRHLSKGKYQQVYFQ